jgi:lantibiotic biosynthesis protein
MTTVTADLQQRIEACVCEVARRLQDPEQVNSIMKQEESLYDGIGSSLPPLWSDLSLAGGLPGLCVLFGALDGWEPDGGWDRIGHGHLVAVQQALSQQTVPGPGLFGGLAGIAFGATALSRNGMRYQNMVAQLNAALIGMTRQVLAQTGSLPAAQIGPAHTDAISGVTGIARYLLLHRDNPDAASVLQALLEFLVRWSEPRNEGEVTVPGWRVGPEFLRTEAERQQHPNGYFDLGLSHGVTGPLAVLSLALTDGAEVPGQRDAILRIAEWVISWQVQDEHGVIWPARVSLEQEAAGNTDPSLGGSAESWCYGAPGIARSLWLAGQALGEPDWCRIAVDAYHAAYRRMQTIGRVQAPTFCHGLAGLLHLTNEMYRDTGLPELGECRDWLAEAVLAAFDPALPFGFADLDAPDMTSRPVNKAGFLEGAAGTVYALASCLSEEEMLGSKLFMLR